MLPAFEVVDRLRPVAVVGSALVAQQYDGGAPAEGASAATPHPAPYGAVEVDLTAAAPLPAGVLTLHLTGEDGVRLAATLDPSTRDVALEVTVAQRATARRSRRHGRAQGIPARIGLTLTGTHLTALTDEGGTWVVRARVELEEFDLDTRDLTWLAGLVSGWEWVPVVADGPPPVSAWRAGGFGRLGLRDLRVVTTRDGAAYRPDGRILLTATGAGPGFFDTAHTSVWSIEPTAPELRHLSDLYFRRPDAPGGFGDHATHLVRDGNRWLVATSTWGDFDPDRPGAGVRITLAETSADLLAGRHLLETRELPVPTDGLSSVGVWDPHLVHTGEEWLVGFVSARRYFDFHPAYAGGPTLDDLTLRGAATGRRATEGTTLLRYDERWHLLASDGPDNPRGLRSRYPVFEVAGAAVGPGELRETGTLAAPYPTNIPWPTLVPPPADAPDDAWWLVTFDGTPYGGRLPGYGTHGDVILLRST